MNNNSCSHSFVLTSKINLFGRPNYYLFLLKNKDHAQARPIRYAPSRQKRKRELNERSMNVYSLHYFRRYVSRNHISLYTSKNMSHQNAAQNKKKNKQNNISLGLSVPIHTIRFNYRIVKLTVSQ